MVGLAELSLRPNQAPKVKEPTGPCAGGFFHTIRQIAVPRPPGGATSGRAVLDHGSFLQPSSPNWESSGSSLRLLLPNCEADAIGKLKIVKINYGGADASCCVDLPWWGLLRPWQVLR